MLEVQDHSLFTHKKERLQIIHSVSRFLRDSDFMFFKRLTLR